MLVETVGCASVLSRLRSTSGPVIVTGPQGSGRTSALHVVAAAAASNGWAEPVYFADMRANHRPTDNQQPRLLLVDDAHALGRAEVRRLKAAFTRTGDRVVVTVASAPWPEHVERMLTTLRGLGSSVQLTPWSVEDIASYLRERSLNGLAIPDADLAFAATGGLPWLVAEYAEGYTRGLNVLAGEDNVRWKHHLDRILGHLDPVATELVLALSAGYDIYDPPTPRPLAGLNPDGRAAVVAVLDHAGLLTTKGVLSPIVAKAISDGSSRHRIRTHQLRLLDDYERLGLGLGAVCERLAATGLRDARLAEALLVRADAAAASNPRSAARAYELAIAAGASASTVLSPMATALFRCGEMTKAAKLVDQAVAGIPLAASNFDADERTVDPDLLRTTVAITLARGMPSRAAELCEWGRSTPTPGLALTAAFTLMSVGDHAAANIWLAADETWHSAPHEGALRLLVKGLRTSLTPDPWPAISVLARSQSTLDLPTNVALLPNSPGFVGALLAIHRGDLSLARALLPPGDTADRLYGDWTDGPVRPGLLHAWLDLADGELDAVAERLDELGDLRPREALWSAALKAGVARRSDRLGEQRRIWGESRRVVLEADIDLFCLLPLGELGCVAARLKDFDLVQAPLAEGARQLASLGEPASWGPALHWYAVQAAISAERPDEIGPHAAALIAATPTSPMAAAAAAGGRAWMAVLTGEFDPDQVEKAARALSGVGQRWEGAHLARHAAARSTDRRETARLLEVAREAAGSGFSDGAAGARRGPAIYHSEQGRIVLTDREAQIAQLVLEGRTYSEIGMTLYLSPRTVESHIRNLRRRSNASSRSQLLELLRTTVYPEDGN